MLLIYMPVDEVLPLPSCCRLSEGQPSLSDTIGPLCQTIGPFRCPPICSSVACLRRRQVRPGRCEIGSHASPAGSCPLTHEAGWRRAPEGRRAGKNVVSDHPLSLLRAGQRIPADAPAIEEVHLHQLRAHQCSGRAALHVCLPKMPGDDPDRQPPPARQRDPPAVFLNFARPYFTPFSGSHDPCSRRI